MRKYRVYGIYLFMSILYLLIFSYSSSPLYDTYGGDSSIFMLIGKGILDGKVPYLDLFDHKGPLLFFIQALGQSIISDRLGIFIFQIINLTLCLIILHKISNLFISNKKSFITSVSFFIILIMTMRNCNISEEYSLIFILSSLYLSLKYYLSEAIEHNYKYSIVYGICSMSLFLIKMNVIIPIGVIVITIVINLMIKKKYKNILINGLAFILGMSIIMIPICIYFIYHGALYEMIYGTILFNLKYMGVGTGKLPLINFIAQQTVTLLPAIIPSISIILIYKNNKKYKLITVIIAFSISFYFTINTGHKYIYYHVLNAIPFSLGIILLIKYFEITKNKIKDKYKLAKLILIGTVTASVLLYVYIGRDIFTILHSQSNSTYNFEAKQLADNIPAYERNSVLGYNTPSQWFMATDILPVTRFYTNQDWWNLFDEVVTDEVQELLDNNPPQWIVTPDLENIQNEYIKKFIESNYLLIESNDVGELYTINE